MPIAYCSKEVRMSCGLATESMFCFLAGCRKNISAAEGGELPKIDFANFLNISSLLVKFNTCLYSPVISHSCFWRNFSRKTLTWILRFLRVRASDFILKILFWWLCHWIFFYIYTNLYNKTSSNQNPLQNPVWCFSSFWKENKNNQKFSLI